MEQSKIEIVKQLAKDYNQFEKSLLQPAIIQVTKCNQSQAVTWGQSHCNLLSWYFGLYADKKIDMSYSEYFKTLLDKNCCNEAGKTLFVKDKIAPICFGFEYDVKYLTNFDNVLNPDKLNKDSFYQLKINNSSHYMISWIEKIELMLADTHDRGYGVLAKTAKRVDKEHFEWMIRI